MSCFTSCLTSSICCEMSFWASCTMPPSRALTAAASCPRADSVWIPSLIALAPHHAAEAEADADAHQDGRHRVAADQVSEVVDHPFQPLFLEEVGAALKGIRGGGAGGADDAAVVRVFAEGTGEVLHAAGD